MRLRLPLLTLLTLIASIAAVPVGVAAAQDEACDIAGTDGDDVLVGTAADEVICGFGGNDLLIGGAGGDRLVGGAGDDRLVGGDGPDHLYGNEGDDELFGGPGADVLWAGEGDDQLVGGPGADVLRGAGGEDTLAGGDGADTLWGGAGNDLVRGAKGPDVAYGGPGDDVVRGGVGVDRLRGGAGTDVCIDSAPSTNGINCSYGRGGDAAPGAVARALWDLLGNDEFVYSVSGPQQCRDGFCRAASFVDVVHVRSGVATSGFGSPARSADELFDLADDAVSRGGSVTFDSALGLPRRIELDEVSAVEIHEIQLRDSTRRVVEAARATWAERTNDRYSYTVETICFCPASAPVRVTVDGEQVMSEPIDDRPVEWTGGVKTIEAHFADIVELLDGQVIDLEVAFDAATGVPRQYSVDRDRQIADEEYSLIISDFAFAAPEPADTSGDDPAGDEPTVVAPGEHPADDVPKVLRIVTVAGIEVSDEIAEDVQALVDAAALDGFVLSGGGFRDPQRQIDLRRANCGTSDFAVFEMPADQCSPPTARPGQSQHELGLAIDFTNNGRLITSQSDPAFVWLAENAATHGLFNLAAEPWHWSTTGN